MYLKIQKQSQLSLLRRVNPYMGRYKIPHEILHEMGCILGNRKMSRRDYIALFIEPVKNDTMDILDGLQLYPASVKILDDEFYSIPVKGKSHPMKRKRIWSWYAIQVVKERYRVYAIFSIKKKDLDNKGGL